MGNASQAPLLTAADLSKAEFQGKSIELLEGEALEMVPAHEGQGVTGGVLERMLWLEIAAKLPEERHQHILITSADMGFLLSENPDTVLVPDYAILDARRLPEKARKSFCRAAPDIAVEILSPSNTRDEMLRKIRLYLSAGTKEVWLIDPEAKTLCVESQDRASPRACRCGDTMACSGLLEGVEVNVSKLFERAP